MKPWWRRRRQKRVHCSLSSNHQNASKTRMGAHRHGWGAGNVVRCFLRCKCCLIVSVDKVFMHYFEQCQLMGALFPYPQRCSSVLQTLSKPTARKNHAGAHENTTTSRRHNSLKRHLTYSKSVDNSALYRILTHQCGAYPIILYASAYVGSLFANHDQ